MRKQTLFIWVLIGLLTYMSMPVMALSGRSEVSDKPYWVQTGVFRYEETADELMGKLENAGYKPFIISDGFMTVYLGPYRNYSEATKVLSDIKGKGFEGFILQKTIEIAETETVDLTLTVDEITRQNSQNKTKSFSLGSDIRMEGVMGSHTIFVPIDEHWSLTENIYVDVYYTTSVISEYPYSTMTLYVNDVPIQSFWIDDTEPGQKHLKVEVPFKHFRQGFNNVTFNSYHRLTNNICEDDANLANWIILGKETSVHVEYEELDDRDDLLAFPYPFIKSSRDLPVDFLMVLPNDPRPVDMDVALMMAAYTGKVNQFSNVNYQVKRYDPDDLSAEKLNNLIWVSDIKSLPQALQAYFSQVEIERLKTEAVVKKVISPFNQDKKVLLLVSDHEEHLIEAVQALTMQSLVDQMDEAVQWFSENEVFSPPEPELSGDYIDLKTLGYGNILFQGRKRGTASVFINVPPTWEITDGAKILVNFKYSDILDFEKSSLSIYVNNVPVGSKGFDEAFVQGDTVILPIPEQVRQDQLYEVRFDMSLIPVNEDCESASFDRNLWGFVSNETVLYLPHDERALYSFERYPAPFVKEGRLNDMLLVLPDELDDRHIQDLSEMLTYIGRGLDVIDEINCISASDFSESDYDNNIITIGTAAENSLIRALNEDMNVPFDETGTAFETRDKMELLSEFSQRVGSAQLFASPLKEGRMMFVITGVDDNHISYVVKYLSDLELLAKLTGDTAFVTGTGALRAGFVALDKSDFEGVESDKFLKGQDADIERKLSSEEIQRFIIIVVVIFLFVIISVVVAARSRHKNS